MPSKSFQKIILVLLPILFVFSSHPAKADTKMFTVVEAYDNNTYTQDIVSIPVVYQYVTVTYQLDKYYYNRQETVHFYVNATHSRTTYGVDAPIYDCTVVDCSQIGTSNLPGVTDWQIHGGSGIYSDLLIKELKITNNATNVDLYNNSSSIPYNSSNTNIFNFTIPNTANSGLHDTNVFIEPTTGVDVFVTDIFLEDSSSIFYAPFYVIESSLTPQIFTR